MKKFSELTKEQQDKAIERSKSIMSDLIFNRGIVFHPSTTKETIDGYAMEAAEDADYNDDGKIMMGWHEAKVK